jgi:hypothetical protein
MSPPHSDEIVVDWPMEHLQQDLDIPIDIFGMRENPFIVERPIQSCSSDDPRISRNNAQKQTKKDKRSAPPESHQSCETDTSIDM